MASRRRVLSACTAAAAAALAGCLPGAGDGTPTGDCTATDPPAPTDAATDPEPYPERPDELTRASLESFLAEYEAAYQYNDALAANPRKIGRTNELTVYVETVTVEADGDGFAANVEGQLQSDIVDRTPATTTPATPTDTPLPMGHGPFEAGYEASERALWREDVVVECW